MNRFLAFAFGLLVGAAVVFHLHNEGLLPEAEVPSASEMPRPPLTGSQNDTLGGSASPGAAGAPTGPSLPGDADNATSADIAASTTAASVAAAAAAAEAVAAADAGLSPAETPSSAASPASPGSTPVVALMIPVSGVKPAQLIDTYTQSRGAGRLHDAIDIMAPRGTPVVAVDDGMVAKLFDSKAGGLTVYQFDGNGKLAYYYAHLDDYAPGVAEGTAVKRGDLIGHVGSTGNANPAAPHLHFAIFVLGPEKNWWQGTPINPYPFLSNRPGKTTTPPPG